MEHYRLDTRTMNEPRCASYMLRHVVILVAVLSLAGCASAAATPTSAPPTPTGTTAVSPAATATTMPARATPTPTQSTPTVPPTPAAGEPLTVASIHMVTAADGWATGSIAQNSSAPAGTVYRTGDGGMQWYDVTPAGVTSDTIPSTYFLDSSQAWVAIASPVASGSTSFTVYRTQDGGQTWDQSEPISIVGGGPSSIDFVDPQHGWLMASLGAGMSHEAVAIYRTTDGGMHWQQVSLTSGMQGESTPGSLPFVCDKSGITFSDTTTGWAGGACPGGELFFYVTRDGGQTWESVALPAPSGYPADLYSQCQCAVSRPTFITPQAGFVTVQIYEQQQRAVLYVTEDAGTTWTPRELPVSQLLGAGPDMVDATTGWLTDGQQLYVTRDAGQTWNEVGTLPLPGEDVRGLDFLNANDGWILGQRPYVTHDGGQTWNTISPVVLAGPSGETETTPTVTLQATFSDPFAYCAAVGTIDTPDARYAGSKVPDSIARGLQTALNVPDTPLEVLANGSSWRCMNGTVYACFVGANLPCDAKANTDRTPTQAEVDFCRQNPTADAIPAYVTGRDTVYEWRCTSGVPTIVQQVFQVDERGFIADVWYPISPH